MKSALCLVLVLGLLLPQCAAQASEWVEDEPGEQYQPYKEEQRPAIAPGSETAGEPLVTAPAPIPAQPGEDQIAMPADPAPSPSPNPLAQDDNDATAGDTYPLVSGNEYPYMPSVPKPQKRNWFLNPQPVGWIDKLGSGIGGVGRGVRDAVGTTAEGTGNMLRSPELWTFAAAAGVITAGYFLMPRNASPAPGYGFGYTNPNVHYVRGHIRNGRWVDGYMQTDANYTQGDNFSALGNENPFTGEIGTKPVQY